MPRRRCLEDAESSGFPDFLVGAGTWKLSETELCALGALKSIRLDQV